MKQARPDMSALTTDLYELNMVQAYLDGNDVRGHAVFAGEKEFWRVARCGHCHHPDEAAKVAADEYRSRWTDFFARRLPPMAPGEPSADPASAP